MVEVKIDAIRVTMMGSRAVILKDAESNRYLSIWIGETEANSISVQLQGYSLARPITHDLIVSIVRDMGASVRQMHWDRGSPCCCTTRTAKVAHRVVAQSPRHLAG